MSNTNNSTPSIKISEMEIFPSALLTECQVAAIAPGETEELHNYRLKLIDHFYTKSQVESAILKSRLEILKQINAIEIPDEYDDTTLSNLIGDYELHLKGLINGALVEVVSNENSVDDASGSKIKLVDQNGDREPDLSLSHLKNILYEPLDSSKVLISSSKGKITTSSINITELNALQGIKNNIQTQLDNLTNRLTKLENKVNSAPSSVGFINYNARTTIAIKKGKGVYPPKLDKSYSYIEYAASSNVWLFAQFGRGDGGDTSCGPRIYMRKKNESDAKLKEVTHIISYDYGQASILMPVPKDTYIRILASGGDMKRAYAWPMA